MLAYITRSTAAVILCGLACAGPLTIRPSEAATLPPAQSLYAQAFGRLGHVSRFQLIETVVQASAQTASEGLRYVAPDGLATVVEVQLGKGRTAAVESVQVGATKCQSPPRAWVCFHSVRPDVPSLVRSLLEPRLHKPEYRVSRGPGDALAISITGKREGMSYAGVLTLGPRSDLPVSFRCTVHQGSRLILTQSASFTYGGRFSIKLPKAGNR
jgi:hypothetical protein